MNLLLDTHAFLWWLADDRRLSKGARDEIAAAQTTVYVSAATIWEIAIKVAAGRLNIERADIVGEITANGFRELPIRAAHANAAGRLPRHHDDPFDRMLIAQGLAEGLKIVTRDPDFAPYGAALLET
ncbi:MAG: type II toxin-antitoxin system VapC family toxin [Candidatus Binatia bacterium]